MDLNRLPEEGSPVPESDVFCSICLDLANQNVERTVVELKCKHKFHLDCIGSAFNSKMEMECPNCRNVEVGDWLFPSGYAPIPDVEDYWNNEAMAHAEMIEPNHLHRMRGVSTHWCPYEDVAPSSTQFNEWEIATGSYTHTHVHRWNGASGHVFEGYGWEHRSLPPTSGHLYSRAEPFSNILPASMHPFLSPLSGGLYDQGLQPLAPPPNYNFIDFLGPVAETGLHNGSIYQCPFCPPSTEQGH